MEKEVERSDAMIDHVESLPGIRALHAWERGRWHHNIATLLATVQSEREKALREACEWIVQLSRGWDQDGSLGPRAPLSWESVGRMAMDYARSALATPPGA